VHTPYDSSRSEAIGSTAQRHINNSEAKYLENKERYGFGPTEVRSKKCTFANSCRQEAIPVSNHQTVSGKAQNGLE